MSDDPLRDFQLPEAPAGLREKALAAARGAFAEPLRPDIWTRLLASRAARLAWAASVAALAAANVLLSRSAARSVPAASAAPAPGRTDAEVAAIARLPRIDEETLPSLEGGRS